MITNYQCTCSHPVCAADLTKREEVTEDGSEVPATGEGGVGGDGSGCEAHHDVRHRHVAQVHPGVHPQL